jgi:glutaredoxin
MKYIFRSVRWVLGQIIIFIDWITRPKPVQHSPAQQAALNEMTSHLALYQFKMCPFCVRTRRSIHRLGLNIETRDARNDAQWNQELIAQGGKYQVPCLRINKQDGSTEWLYESANIRQYLEQRFADKAS